MTPEEAGQARRESANKYQRKVDRNARDIAGDDWDALIRNIDWDRRLATRRNLQRFGETYLPNIYYLEWSEDQLRCLRKTETVFIDSAMFALAMPRGGGKTGLTRGGLTWGTLHGWKRFPFNVGSTDPKSLQTLEAVKSFLYGSPRLLQDFPEICWPIRKTENRFHLARGQTFYGELTYVEWGSNSVRYPCLLLPKEDAEVMLKPRVNGKLHSWADGEEPLLWLDSHQAWIPRSAGINIATAGIGGAIRGEAETHPVTLEQPRPDVVILDDIQKDQAADSPAQVDKLVLLVEGAIGNLAGPGRHVSIMMPCTVTREGDCSDTFLDHVKKPEYRGERCHLVSSWPDGITDTQISLETEAGKLWNKYGEIRRQAFRDFESHSRLCDDCSKDLTNPCPQGVEVRDAATSFYAANREVMDKDFVVTWKERYGDPVLQMDGTIKRNGRELSPQQHAMNLRFKSPETFPAEYQNRGRKLNAEGDILISAGQLAAKSIAVPKDVVPYDCQYHAAFMDVQNEILFWGMLSVNPGFGGVFHYGTYPELTTRYFTKNQTEGWSLLTREFFKAYPEYKDKAIKTEGGRIRAPLEAKIYHALTLAVPYLMNKVWVKQDEHQTQVRIARLAIDTRWGQAADVIKRYIKESGFRDLVPYMGQAFPPTNKQLEEYQRTGAYKGWLFEDQVHPNLKEPKWVLRPNPDGLWYLAADVSRLKDFIFARLASPLGSSGSISLGQGTPDEHELVADHICRSEYPEPVTARGLTKNQWKPRAGSQDNDWLDCIAGASAVASWLGACLITGGEASSQRGNKVSNRWKKKRGQQG